MNKEVREDVRDGGMRKLGSYGVVRDVGEVGMEGS